MYIPAAFDVQDPKRLAQFIAENSFATVITRDEAGLPFASHLPLLHEPEPEPAGRLVGHLARANSQWKHFAGQQEVLVIFHGPHAYISPRWYATSPAVPTWNYAVVHAYGLPKIIAEESELEKIVRKLVRFYEGEGENSWRGELPREFMQKQLKAIVGFEISLTRWQGKFKLGQNRQLADRTGVYEALSASERADDRQLAEFMKAEGVVGNITRG